MDMNRALLQLYDRHEDDDDNNDNDDNNNMSVKEKVRRKAEEYLRLSLTRSSHLGDCECGRAVVCVLLSLHHFRLSCNETTAFKISGIRRKQSFQATVSALRAVFAEAENRQTKALPSSSSSSAEKQKERLREMAVREMAVKMRCPEVFDNALRCYEHYRRSVLEETHEYQRTVTADHFDNKTVPVAAAVFIAAKRESVRVGKDTGARMAGTSVSEFGRVVSAMALKLGVKLEEKKKKKGEKEEQKEKEDDAVDAVDAPIEDDVVAAIVNKAIEVAPANNNNNDEDEEDEEDEEDDDDDDDEEEDDDGIDLQLKRKRDQFEDWKQRLLKNSRLKS